MTDFASVAEYHRVHGDDYGSEEARLVKYQTILYLMPLKAGERHSVLDVGCGSGGFEDYLKGWNLGLSENDVPLSTFDYTGIDLLAGQNVLDYEVAHDVVVANGVLYQMRSSIDAYNLLAHCWMLARKALIFTTLSDFRRGELSLHPEGVVRFAEGQTDRWAIRHDYLPGDMTVAMYR